MWYSYFKEDTDKGKEFEAFVDVNGEQSQIRLKRIELWEQGQDSRKLSSFDSEASPRQLSLRPSGYWLDEWMQYIDERRKEFKVIKVERKRTPLIFRAGFIDFDSDEYQDVLKMLDAEKRFSHGYSWRAPSPVDPTATPPWTLVQVLGTAAVDSK
jgi:hypothetical protein